MRICSFRHPARHPGDWHSRQAMPSGSKGWTQREPPVSIQARQAVPAVRQQPAEQPDPAARRALTRQPASKLAVRPAPSAAGRPVLLPRNLIMNKQVITRTTGKQLGYIAQVYVDPQRMEVVSLDLRLEWISLKRSADSSIMLSALRQIGDVVLVHDESAANDSTAMAASWGAVKLIGMAVETEDGRRLGKVKDFTFSPDDGRIDSIKFDRYGLPAVPDSLFSVCGLSVWDVMRVETSRLVVQSSVQISKETDGLLDRATEALFNLQGAEHAEDYQSQLQDWERQYGSTYRAYYGQAPQQLQLPPAKDRQSVRKILTSAYSERERVPVPRQTSLMGAQQQATAYDPRQRRPSASSAVPSSSGADRGSLQPTSYPMQPSSVMTEQWRNVAARRSGAEPQGVPLMRRQQLPPHQLRDVDGAYGEVPAIREKTAALYPANESQPVLPAEPGLRYEDFLMSGSTRDRVEVHLEQ